MKIILKESEFREYINNVVKESIEEGEWMDSAKSFGKAGLNFAKETGKKIGQGAEWLGNKIGKGLDSLSGGVMADVESDFLYALQRNGIDTPMMLGDNGSKMEELKAKYPQYWAYACKNNGVDPNSI